jgi:IS5 family transposase
LGSTLNVSKPLNGGAECEYLEKGCADQALGRPRGGSGTKLHIAVDGVGNPVEFIPTGGQEADISQGKALIEDHDSEAVLADKGYDGDDLVAAIEAIGAEAVIPPKKNRIFKRKYDQFFPRNAPLPSDSSVG